MPAASFELVHQDGDARAGILHTPHGPIETPNFCVTGTAGAVKGITPAELRELGAQALLANSYHLGLRPGHEAVKQLGGLHRFLAWDGPIISDSGAFQVVSLGFGDGSGSDESPARPEEMSNRNRGQQPRLLRVDDQGLSFTSHIDGSQHRLTPEISIRVQEALGADVILAFDQPTSSLDDAGSAEKAIRRTHAWALRCLDVRTRDDQALFGVAQGGVYPELRAESASFIAGLPFDGVAIGGSLGTSEADLRAVLDRSIPLLPERWPRHLPGVGEPENLFACVERGIDQFDAVTPTRLGRHGVLYTAAGKINILAPANAEDTGPIEPGCACYACSSGFSRGYLRHLFLADELLAYTLASLHNLHFILSLMRRIRQAILADAFMELRDEFLSRYRGGTPT